LAAVAGSEEATRTLGELARRRDESDTQVAWYLKVAGTTRDPWILVSLADAVDKCGRTKEADRWLRRAVELDEGRAMSDMLPRLQRRGLLESAVEWLSPAAQRGVPEALYAVGNLSEVLDRTDEAVDWYRQATAAGHPYASHALVRLLESAGEVDEVGEVLRRAATVGHASDQGRLTAFLLEHPAQEREPDEGRRLAFETARVCGKHTYRMLVNLFTRLGLDEDADTIRRLRSGGTVEGPVAAAQEPAERELKPGDPRGVEELFQVTRAAGPGWTAARRLTEYLVGEGRAGEAIEFWSRQIESGKLSGLADLVRLLDKRDGAGAADDLLRRLVDHEVPVAMMMLARRATEAGDDGTAQTLLRRALPADSNAREELSRLLERAERYEEAAGLWQEKALGGSGPALRRVVSYLKRAGRLDNAERMLVESWESGRLEFSPWYWDGQTELDDVGRYGIEPGGRVAEAWQVPRPPGRRGSTLLR
jgi:tetratricopeptide (TPR) repeat protein